jgi:predicted nucleotidyltransferase
MSRAIDPNRAILLRVAQALGNLRESLVFVGGCATGLLVTTIRAQVVRPTDDVDMVAKATTAREYHAVEKQLQAQGFAHDVSADAPICRWRYEGIMVDLMPSEEGVLSFHNIWYPLAVKTAHVVKLDDEISIRLIAAPVFIATKLEAFQGRGKGDFLMSHDLEDIITVIDGRASLIAEARALPPELCAYLARNFRALLAEPAFLDALTGHLPGDAASQARLPGLINKFNEIAQLDKP